MYNFKSFRCSIDKGELLTVSLVPACDNWCPDTYLNDKKEPLHIFMKPEV